MAGRFAEALPASHARRGADHGARPTLSNHPDTLQVALYDVVARFRDHPIPEIASAQLGRNAAPGTATTYVRGRAARALALGGALSPVVMLPGAGSLNPAELVKDGNAVIVVHGLDPAIMPGDTALSDSPISDDLPLAATALLLFLEYQPHRLGTWLRDRLEEGGARDPAYSVTKFVNFLVTELMDITDIRARDAYIEEHASGRSPGGLLPAAEAIVHR